MSLWLQAVKWVTAGLKVLFLNWQGNIPQTKPVSHSNSSYNFVFSLALKSFLKHPCMQSACQFLCSQWLVWGCGQGEHQILQKFPEKMNGSRGAAHSSLGMTAPITPHSGQPKSKPLLSLTNFYSLYIEVEDGFGGSWGLFVRWRGGDLWSIGGGLDVMRPWWISLLSRILYEKIGSTGRGLAAHFFVLTTTGALQLRIPLQNPIDCSCGGSRNWIKGSCRHPAGACPSGES